MHYSSEFEVEERKQGKRGQKKTEVARGCHRYPRRPEVVVCAWGGGGGEGDLLNQLCDLSKS